MGELGRFLILAGCALVLTGVVLGFGVHIPWLGKLPGDIAIKKENLRFYFPFTTSLLVSAILSLLLRLLRK